MQLKREISQVGSRVRAAGASGRQSSANVSKSWIQLPDHYFFFSLMKNIIIRYLASSFEIPRWLENNYTRAPDYKVEQGKLQQIQDGGAFKIEASAGTFTNYNEEEEEIYEQLDSPDMVRNGEEQKKILSDFNPGGQKSGWSEWEKGKVPFSQIKKDQGLKLDLGNKNHMEANKSHPEFDEKLYVALSCLSGSTKSSEDDIDDIYSVEQKVVHEISARELAESYKQDAVMSRIIQHVKEGRKPDKEERKTLTSIGMTFVNHFECLNLDDGILYYQAPEVNGIVAPRRICLPVKLYNIAFQMCHADQAGTSGHYGINNTFQKMKQRFYFPNMFGHVTARINNCIPCIKKRPNPPKGRHLQHREQLSYFNQRVYCDVVGPLTTCRSQGENHKYLLTIQDGFTRYLVASPMPDQTTETIVKTFINNWIYVFGCMEVLHTDRGSAYTSKLFQEVMRALGIVKTVTPAYSPEGDRVERAHRVLGDLLRSDERHEAYRWTDKLHAALLAYNASVNRSTGLSPFEAVFHRPVTLPVDLVFPFQRPEGKSWSNHVETLRKQLSRLCEKICVTQKTGIMRDNARFQGRSQPTFQTGDLCYYHIPCVKQGLSKKLGVRWLGPFTVRKVVSEALVIIYPTGTWCINPREIAAIVNRLKQVKESVTLEEYNPPSKIDLEIIANDLDEEAEYLTTHQDVDHQVTTRVTKENQADNEYEEAEPIESSVADSNSDEGADKILIEEHGAEEGIPPEIIDAPTLGSPVETELAPAIPVPSSPTTPYATPDSTPSKTRNEVVPIHHSSVRDAAVAAKFRVKETFEQYKKKRKKKK